jgi:hypothetical protein
VADALTYCDETTSPTGEQVTLKQRMADILARHGKESIVVQAHKLASRYNTMAVARTIRRLKVADIIS